MPTVTINGQECPFQDGQSILEVACDHEIEIPHYCWHPALSVPSNCRICLAEIWAPNPRNDGKLDPLPKLMATCRTPCVEGQVVRTDTDRAQANQEAVTEYLLANHPVDCPICDQAGECDLQDYSYRFGRGPKRYDEDKITQSKKDVGPDVLLYGDRCIMCTLCVRFTREITGTGELIVKGRGATEEIDVFPGRALDNELAGNVVDLCPVGALLDKHFLFKERVWELTATASIDGLTASGDNCWIDHRDGVVQRLRPRPNPDINRFWITDEVRHGWFFVHDEHRLAAPTVHVGDPGKDPWRTALTRANEALSGAGRLALSASPFLTCEDAWHLARWITRLDPKALLAVGEVPAQGEDRTYPDGYVVRAEKAPNARGVRRVLEHFSKKVLAHDEFVAWLEKDDAIGGVLVAAGAPGTPAERGLVAALSEGNRALVLVDVLPTMLQEHAEVVLPGAAWCEKAGTFEDAAGRLQAFDAAIAPPWLARPEAQVAMDALALLEDEPSQCYDATGTRAAMAEEKALSMFAGLVAPAPAPAKRASDMPLVELTVSE